MIRSSSKGGYAVSHRAQADEGDVEAEQITEVGKVEKLMKAWSARERIAMNVWSRMARMALQLMAVVSVWYLVMQIAYEPVMTRQWKSNDQLLSQGPVEAREPYLPLDKALKENQSSEMTGGRKFRRWRSHRNAASYSPSQDLADKRVEQQEMLEIVPPVKSESTPQSERAPAQESETENLAAAQVPAQPTTLSTFDEIPRLENWPNQTFIDAIVNSEEAGKGPKRLLVAAVSCNFLDMADNWLTALEKVGVKNYLIIALDDEAYRRLHKVIPNHVLSSPIQAVSHSATYGSEGFANVVRSRPVLLTHLLRTGYHVMYSDVDMVYNSNPFEEFPAGFDLVAPTDSYLTEVPELTKRDKENICTGLLYLAPTDMTFELLARWNTKLIRGQKKLNQFSFNLALVDMGYVVKPTPRINVHVLDKDAFPPGFMYFKNELWEHATEWVPKRSVVMVHNNYMQKANNKVHRFKQFDLWNRSGRFDSCEAFV